MSSKEVTMGAVAKSALKRQLTGKPSRLFKDVNKLQKTKESEDIRFDKFVSASAKKIKAQQVVFLEGSDVDGAFETAVVQRDVALAQLEKASAAVDNQKQLVMSQLHVDPHYVTQLEESEWDDIEHPNGYFYNAILHDLSDEWR